MQRGASTRAHTHTRVRAPSVAAASDRAMPQTHRADEWKETKRTRCTGIRARVEAPAHRTKHTSREMENQSENKMLPFDNKRLTKAAHRLLLLHYAFCLVCVLLSFRNHRDRNGMH